MIPIYLAFYQLGSIFSDFEIIMKIAGLLFIVSFVRQHIQHPILSVLVILGLSAFLLFDFWKIFGSALFLYILVSFGVLHILVDLSFLGAFHAKPSKEDMERAQNEQRRAQKAQEEYARQAHQAQYAAAGQSMHEEYEHEGGHGHQYSHGTQAHSGPSMTQRALQFLTKGKGGGHR